MTDKKQTTTENKKTSVKEGKIVNMCEDMNPHKHNSESYDKMMAEQNARK